MSGHGTYPGRRSAPARAGRVIGLTAGFVSTAVWGWTEVGRRMRRAFAPIRAISAALQPVARGIRYTALGIEAWLTLPSRALEAIRPRAAVGDLLGGMGNILVAFGAACLILGAGIRISRHARLALAADNHAAPSFDAAVWPTAVPIHANAVTVFGTPDRIVIPAIGVDEEVRPVGWTHVFNGADEANTWETANYAAGFHESSASPGLPGNTVISGHNNIFGAIFRDLYKLVPGQKVYLVAGNRELTYIVEQSFIVQESGVALEKRLENARWIAATPDERLTLVSCYPPWGNTHRAIVVARPLAGSLGLTEEVLPPE